MLHHTLRVVDLDFPILITTSRLLLRRYNPSDAPLLKAAIDSSLDHLKASVAWAVHEPTRLDALAERLAQFERAFNTTDSWGFAILDPAETRILGGCGCERAEHPLEELVGGDTIEVGYWLRADALGQGIATEATGALVTAIFEHLRPARIAICHDPANVPSGGVPRRLGFRLHGTVSRDVLPGRLAADGSERTETVVWVLDRPTEETGRG